MKSISCPLYYNAKNLSKHSAVIYGKRIVSYEELFFLVQEAKDFLRCSGVSEQMRVGIFASNSLEYLVTIYALWYLKAVPCLISTRLPEVELEEHLQFTRCAFLICGLDELLSSQIIQTPKIDLRKTITDKPLSAEYDKSFEFDFNQNATILFTSGSTGTPKAVLHTFANHYYSALGSNKNISVSARDKWLLSLPLYHVGGLSIFFRILLGKATIVIPDAQTPTIDSITEHRVTHLSLVVTQLYRLLQEPSHIALLKNMKAILIGGSAIPKTLIRDAIKHNLPTYTTYGSTEMSSQIATSEIIKDEDQISKARILEYRAIKINSAGEILVKGETLFKGYIDGNKVKTYTDKDGWFATGDLGFISDEFLTVTGRKDNMFISGGENIQPEEIEHYLGRIAEIEQAIVVPIASKEFGFRPVAFIRPYADSIPEKEKFISTLKEHLPKFKIPEQFYIWPKEWDVTGLKANRKRLSQLVQNENPDLKLIA